ncbi:hypothetical protein I6F34_01495 [Bradyrhizobium sp. BRP05]|nr:hypothetical protein [Bradyrhizobium sp. BRP05]
MRVFQVTPDGLTSLFDAHHAQEAAEHAAFGAPVDPDAAGFDSTLADIADALDEDGIEIGFDSFFPDLFPDFFPGFGPALKSEQEQLDQLGDIVENVSILAGMYAALVADARSQNEDEA